ncbi:hypothetical protein AS27_12533, partial [Aptenodytes forsteri]
MLFSISAILNSTLLSSKASPASPARGAGAGTAGPAMLTAWARAYWGAGLAPASACPTMLNAFSTACSGSRSLKRGRRFTVSDSVRLNSGTGGSLAAAGTTGSFPAEQGGSTSWELGSVSRMVASALGCPVGFGRCLMVKLPSSAKGMHSLELFWEDEEETPGLASSSVSEQASSRPPCAATSVMGALGSLNVRLRGLLLSKGSLLASESVV